MAGGASVLIERIMRAHGIEPDERGAVPALARVTGLPERYLYRWLEKTPSYENAIDLLERAGMLRDTPAPPVTIDVEERVIELLATREMTPDRAALARILSNRLRARAETNLELARRLDELAGPAGA